MNMFRLVIAEIVGRPLNFVLSLLVVILAAALFVVGPTVLRGYSADTQHQLRVLQAETDALLDAMQREADEKLAELDRKTTRIMRDLGVNLRIVHQDTKMIDLYTDFVAVDFPEEYVERLANAPQIETIVHLIATLQEKIKWNQRTVLLVGMLPVLTASQKNIEQPHMAQPVEPGTVVVGHELAAGLSGPELARADANGNGRLDVGEELEILGRGFRVAEIRPEAGTLEDVQLVLHLHDAQQLVDKPGRIHQIMALNCKCTGNRISVIRQELEGVLPDTKVTEHLSRATAREEQRDLVAQQRRQQIELMRESRGQQLEILHASRRHWERMLNSLVTVMLPLEVLIAALMIALMTWLNVRERRCEIGLLRALGKRTGQIAALFLGKAALIGLIGGTAAGMCCLATYLAVSGPAQAWSSVSDIELFRPSATLLLLTVLGAPVVTVMAAYLPMLAAVQQDPARVLTEN
jgi:putative ABC transport system permease protein